MSKELQGLDITDNPRGNSDLYSWLPRENHPETSRPITTFVIGLSPTEKAFYPVEIDLTKKSPKTIFIVGDEESRKERFMLGLVKRASATIAPGYLKISVITDTNDPNGLLHSRWLEKHLTKPSPTAFPEGSVATRILNSVSKKLTIEKGTLKLIDLNPSLLLIENLGNFLLKTANQPEKLSDFKRIISHTGRQPHLTVTTVNYADLPLLKDNGISPDTTPAVWLFGKSDTPELTNVFPGGFLVWNSKKKNYSAFSIITFDFPES